MSILTSVLEGSGGSPLGSSTRVTVIQMVPGVVPSALAAVKDHTITNVANVRLGFGGTNSRRRNQTHGCAPIILQAWALRRTLNALTLDQHIGVRIPGGQPSWAAGQLFLCSVCCCRH
jgi:hypothetical protein